MSYSKIRWIFYTVLLVVTIWLNIEQYVIELYMRYKISNEEIIIALSTTPYRINHIHKTLDTLFKQNAPVKKIYLSVPYEFKRDNLEYKIPQWLQDEKRITILRTQDYGPATKLLGVLEQINLNATAIIITVDDDVDYPQNLALQLAYKAKHNPKFVIALAGADPDRDTSGNIPQDSQAMDGIVRQSSSDAFAAIVQGFAGIAYRKQFFDDAIFEIISAPQTCINSDDLYISFYLAKRKIPRQVLKNKYISYHDVDYGQTLGYQADALHNLSPKPIDKHRDCIAFMQRNNQHVAF